MIFNKKNENKFVHLIYFSSCSKHDSTEIRLIKFIPLMFIEDEKINFLFKNGNISYEKRDNIFKLSLHHYFKTATLSGIGKGFYVVPKFIRGFGIGTFAFYYLFNWALEKNCGHYSLNKQPIGGEEDSLLRFFLYLNTGFSLTAEAVKTQCKSGEYFASSIKNLSHHLPDTLFFKGSFDEYYELLNNKFHGIKSELNTYLDYKLESD